MSTQTESVQSPQHNENHLMITEAAMREIAQELGTAQINRLLMADTVRRLQASLAAFQVTASTEAGEQEVVIDDHAAQA